MTGCDKCSCDGKVESKSTDSRWRTKDYATWHWVQFCNVSTPLTQEADGFQLLIDSGSSKHFIDTELLRGVESRIQEYIRIEPSMEMTAAGNNVLRGTTQGTLLVVARRTYNALRTVILSIVLVPGQKVNLL